MVTKVVLKGVSYLNASFPNKYFRLHSIIAHQSLAMRISNNITSRHNIVSYSLETELVWYGMVWYGMVYLFFRDSTK